MINCIKSFYGYGDIPQNRGFSGSGNNHKIQIRKDKVMAKPKVDFIISVVRSEKNSTGIIHLWIDEIIIRDIMSIEGIASIDIPHSPNAPTFVYVNARYDAHEVAAEMEELLSAKIPDAFYESPD